jgi:hypothetical protein
VASVSTGGAGTGAEACMGMCVNVRRVTLNLATKARASALLTSLPPSISRKNTRKALTGLAVVTPVLVDPQ